MGRMKTILQIVVIAVLVAGIVVPFLTGTSPALAKTENPYVVRTFIDDEGNEIAMIVVPGRPPETRTRAVGVPESDIQMGINALSHMPAFDWSYGCSATSAAMLFGYYDRMAYNNMYAGTTNDGVCPLDNSSWGPGIGGSDGECPLSATHMGIDDRATRGHVDDYWISYLSTGPDPWVGSWTEHTQGDCTADYMGTNQWKYGEPIEYNIDGGTIFFSYTDGSPFVDPQPAGYRDGCHGMRLFAESRGYSVVANFNQYIYGYDGNTLGFTFADFMAEIDAGRPVLIQVEGHTMLGYGYDTDGEVVYIHDTWDYSSHTMTWGGSYSGMTHYGVTVIRLADPPSPTEVWVDENFDAATPGWGYDHFATIQGGIGAVSGSTVHVAAGTYTENITLEDGVEVLGAGADVTTISSGGSVVTASSVGSSTKLDGFTITNGSATNGGGMHNENSSPVVSNCTFSANDATDGGGMYNNNSSPTVTNCTFSANDATDGGGMYNNNSSPTVTNCTFSGNPITNHGGGMYNESNSNPTVTNCILWDGGDEIYDDASAPVVSYCDIQGGFVLGSNIIDTDPMFVGGGDYHLQLGSPCIDVGNDSAPSIPSTDFEGDPRIMDGDGDLVAVVDMGADERETLANDPPNAPASPLCEGETNPTDVTDPTPEFGWTFSDPDGGDSQGAYQVLVASSSGNLAADTGDLWDSGEVSGSDSEVSYAGLALNWYQTYYWKVKTWDDHDAEGPYCSEQQFTTGILSYGQLRLETDPAVPTTISIDGIPRSAWGLDWVKMLPGEYTLSFTDTPGYLAPEVIEVTYPGEDAITQPVTEPITVYVDETTEVMVHCVHLGNLWVRTDPAVSTIVSLDGTPPSNNWGFWVDLLPGDDYHLSVGDVVGYATPVEVEVTYPGEAPITQAIADPITVEPGGTTAVVVHFILLGNLKVDTSPDLPATIFVDGEPMNKWGFWLYLEAGDYTVSFEDMDGYTTPPPTVVTVTAGVTTDVTADYDNGLTIVN